MAGNGASPVALQKNFTTHVGIGAKVACNGEGPLRAVRGGRGKAARWRSRRSL
jgi:hypothetical protein